MPLEFSADWTCLSLKLPRNLRTLTLRQDYVELLKKIRSVACSNCDAGPMQPGGGSRCVQEEGGSRTWKCKACFDSRKKSCDWMRSKSPLSSVFLPPILVQHMSECAQFGLGSQPSVQRVHSLGISSSGINKQTSKARLSPTSSPSPAVSSLSTYHRDHPPPPGSCELRDRLGCRAPSPRRRYAHRPL